MPPQASQALKKKAPRQERPKVPKEPSRRSSRYDDNVYAHNASPLLFSLQLLRLGRSTHTAYKYTPTNSDWHIHCDHGCTKRQDRQC